MLVDTTNLICGLRSLIHVFVELSPEDSFAKVPKELFLYGLLFENMS